MISLVKFYTNVSLDRNHILLRGYYGSERIHRRIPYKPTLYIHSQTANAEYRNLKGKSCGAIKFDSIGEARDYTKRYGDVEGHTIYGMTNYIYAFINEYYPEIDYDPKMISRVNIDIEVAADQGFPNIQTADKEITAITMKKDDTYIVLGCGDFKSNRNSIEYIKCADESELLLKFLDVWRNLNPDLIKAPKKWIDYVMVHELCHLKIRNHSSGYYRLLKKIMPDWEERKIQLEQTICN